jgi:hypothetical protein
VFVATGEQARLELHDLYCPDAQDYLAEDGHRKLQQPKATAANRDAGLFSAFSAFLMYTEPSVPGMAGRLCFDQFTVKSWWSVTHTPFANCAR